MNNQSDAQQLESFVPVYDTVPDNWEDARPFLVEQFKRISNAVNIREIGWFLDEELLSGKAFIPGLNIAADGGSSQQFRQILRKVIVFPGLVPGVNFQNHNITIDSNFTLIQMFGAATNATTLVGEPIPNGTDTTSYNATQVAITVSAPFTRAFLVMEYMQEL